MLRLPRCLVGVGLGLALAVSSILPLEAAGPTRADVVGWTYRYAAYYGTNPAVLLAVARCESRFAPYAVGRAGEAGPYQFHPRGLWWGTPQARAGYSRWNPEATTAAAAWAFSRGLGRHWTCYRILYRGRG